MYYYLILLNFSHPLLMLQTNSPALINIPMNKLNIKLAVPFLILCSCISSYQTASGQDLKKKFHVVNRTLSVDKYSGALHLDEVDSVGIAWINGKEFTEGIIEFDSKGKDKFQGSFLGIAFHGLNDTTYESVYFRPFNFRAADPIRKAHAVQYIANPKYDWPQLRADFPNQYEKPVLPELDPDQWFHVKIVVIADRVRVFVNGNDDPVLDIQSLGNSEGKMVGYWAGNGSGGDWNNLKITHKH